MTLRAIVSELCAGLVCSYTHKYAARRSSRNSASWALSQCGWPPCAFQRPSSQDRQSPGADCNHSPAEEFATVYSKINIPAWQQAPRY